MTSQYVPGKGYTVRNQRGIVLAHSLTAKQRDALLALQGMGVIPVSLLLNVLKTQ